jgi:hypothetical protein
VSTIRTGNHWHVTIVDDGTQPPDASGHRPDARLLAVVMAGKVLTPDPELAERVARLLNEGPRLDDAILLLEYALHLRQHGERAPGGNETWAEFDRRCEAFLRQVSASCATESAEIASGVPASTPDVHGGSQASTVECKLVRPAGPGPTDPCGCRPSQPCAMQAERKADQP